MIFGLPWWLALALLTAGVIIGGAVIPHVGEVPYLCP